MLLAAMAMTNISLNDKPLTALFSSYLHFHTFSIGLYVLSYRFPVVWSDLEKLLNGTSRGHRHHRQLAASHYLIAAAKIFTRPLSHINSRS